MKAGTSPPGTTRSPSGQQHYPITHSVGAVRSTRHRTSGPVMSWCPQHRTRTGLHRDDACAVNKGTLHPWACRHILLLSSHVVLLECSGVGAARVWRTTDTIRDTARGITFWKAAPQGSRIRQPRGRKCSAGDIGAAVLTGQQRPKADVPQANSATPRRQTACAPRTRRRPAAARSPIRPNISRRPRSPTLRTPFRRRSAS